MNSTSCKLYPDGIAGLKKTCLDRGSAMMNVELKK